MLGVQSIILYASSTTLYRIRSLLLASSNVTTASELKGKGKATYRPAAKAEPVEQYHGYPPQPQRLPTPVEPRYSQPANDLNRKQVDGDPFEQARRVEEVEE